MPTMRFEHLVQINDPLMPLLDTLTRSQLWRGLVMRIEDPVPFLYGLRGCTIEDRSDSRDASTFARTLDFGNFKVHDRVTLKPMDRVEVQAAAGETYPASRLTIRIEEPGPELLFLRFLYEIGESADDSDIDPMTVAFRRQAYENSDIDTVKRIRALAGRGMLG
jgi:hypothetical protein